MSERFIYVRVSGPVFYKDTLQCPGADLEVFTDAQVDAEADENDFIIRIDTEKNEAIWMET